MHDAVRGAPRARGGAKSRVPERGVMGADRGRTSPTTHASVPWAFLSPWGPGRKWWDAPGEGGGVFQETGRDRHGRRQRRPSGRCGARVAQRGRASNTFLGGWVLLGAEVIHVDAVWPLGWWRRCSRAHGNSVLTAGQRPSMTSFVPSFIHSLTRSRAVHQLCPERLLLALPSVPLSPLPEPAPLPPSPPRGRGEHAWGCRFPGPCAVVVTYSVGPAVWLGRSITRRRCSPAPTTF